MTLDFHLNQEETASQAENTDHSRLAWWRNSSSILFLLTSYLNFPIDTSNHFFFNVIAHFSLRNFGAFQEPEFQLKFAHH